MADKPSDIGAPKTAWRQSRWLILGESVLVVALLLADSYHMVPLSSTPLWFALGWISLRLRGLRWRDVGFVRPRSWPQALAVGSLAGIGMEVFSTFVSVPLLSQFVGKPPDLSDFRPMAGNLTLLFGALVPMWLLAAFGEELVYRGYLMNRVAALGQNTRAAWLLSLVLVSALFGWGHAGQELTGMLQEGFAGLLLGLLYLGWGRNLAIPIIAHGTANTLAFVLIFLDRYPGV